MALDENDTFINTTNDTRPGFVSNIDPIKQTLYSLFFVVSLIGNSLVIAVVYKNSNKKMRTTINLFVVNMAVSDLLTTMIPLPTDMVLNIVGQWPIRRGSIVGLVLCKISFATWILLSGVSLLSVMVIAFDRFWAVFFPTKRPAITKRPAVTMSVIWVVCFGFQFPFFYRASVVLEDGKRVCSLGLNLSDHFYTRYLQVVQSVCFTILPVITILVLYPVILVKLWKRQIPGNPSAVNQELRDRTNRKVTIMAVALMTSFIISWFPLLVEHFLVYLNPSYSKTFAKITPVTFILTYSSGALNPIICIVFNDNFRRSFVAMLGPPCGSNCTRVSNDTATNPGMINLGARFEGSAVGLDNVQVVKVVELNRS